MKYASPDSGPSVLAKRDGTAVVSSSSERSLRLLAVLAQAGRPTSLAELASNLDLPKATVHRLCGLLLELGYMVRDIDERSFITGPALHKLALDTMNCSTVQGLRHAVLADLVAHVGETCNFTTLDGVDVLYIDRVEAPWPWRLKLEAGEHVPLHATASGKLFLATMDPARRAQVLGQLKLQKLTPNTLTEPDRLIAECEAITANGYAIDREEFIGGLVAVAVPVSDSEGKVRAAIAIHGPTTRMSIEQMITHVPALRKAAASMAPLL